jgi:hypothetical protein
MADRSFLDWPFFEPIATARWRPKLERGVRPTCPWIMRIPMPPASGW